MQIGNTNTDSSPRVSPATEREGAREADGGFSYLLPTSQALSCGQAGAKRSKTSQTFWLNCFKGVPRELGDLHGTTWTGVAENNLQIFCATQKHTFK